MCDMYLEYYKKMLHMRHLKFFFQARGPTISPAKQCVSFQSHAYMHHVAPNSFGGSSTPQAQKKNFWWRMCNIFCNMISGDFRASEGNQYNAGRQVSTKILLIPVYKHKLWPARGVHHDAETEEGTSRLFLMVMGSGGCIKCRLQDG